jgi:hypothetical protein
MGVRDLIASFIRADPLLSEIEPYRRAGCDAYDLIDSVQPASWTALAAWNAYVPQVYGDNLISASTSGRHVAAEVTVFARRLFEEANRWVEEARKAEASESYRFTFEVPFPLPHWVDSLRTDAQLSAMRTTLDAGRMRTASGAARFSGEDALRGRLRVLEAEVDAETVYVERLWTGKPTDELRATISFSLAEALDHVYELGQLLAQPALLKHGLEG